MITSRSMQNILPDTAGLMNGGQQHSITVKLGGSTTDERRVIEQLSQDVAQLLQSGYAFIIVHGGGKEISRVMDERGIRPRKVAGLRVTDDATMAVVEQVMNKMNDEICSVMRSIGLSAVKVIGAEGLLICDRKGPVQAEESGKTVSVDLMRVGTVRHVKSEILSEILRQGKVPVVAPYGQGDDGMTLNVNADTAAGSIAGATSEELILLTDVDGVVASRAEGRPAHTLTVAETRDLIDKGVIHGGMLPKIEACIHAIECGVSAARIVNGFADHPLKRALSENSIGTKISP
ncbi:MAG TPA: acetylglutamate kinase [Euryarchaeota archaeon]|nr:acetylglutamate kinase [Euryarchaeota archaeon]